MKRFFTPELKKVIFFDMNQTLMDPQQSFNEGLIQTLKEYMGRWQSDDITTHEKILQVYWEELHKKKLVKGKQSMKKTAIQQACLAVALKSYPLPEKEAFLRSFLHRTKEHQDQNPQLYTDVKETLEQLSKKPYRLAIISNGNRTKQEQQINVLGLNNLIPSSHHFTPQKGSTRKPHPAFFRYALESMGITANHGVMVGNSWKSDVLGAVSAGLDVVWLQPTLAKQSSLRKIGGQRVVVVRKFEQLNHVF